ncbi:hypothetical protein BDN72DRAFT_641225 [Pluteus cervinus]|uniref:Uncharacterized protein n=1 Tax=Pluteus cervinus TaxID=181527 RepID=A0ACD3AST3_9AGAR|nr:hypothetical protein BDN72DRAFT_641225 [Pluteus cervinus]
MSEQLVNTADAFAVPTEVYRTLFGITDTDRDIVCNHEDDPKLPSPDQDLCSDCRDLCSDCRDLSYEYWHPFLSRWTGSLRTKFDLVPEVVLDLKLERMLQYAIAINELEESGFAPPLGLYPREAVVERLFGMSTSEMDVIAAYCVRKPSPVEVFKWETVVPPYISHRLRRFLTDPWRARDGKDVPYLWDMGIIHRGLAKIFIQAFFDQELDVEEGGQEVKAYAGLMWVPHAIHAKGGIENVVLSEFFQVEEFVSWFRWASEEQWKVGIPSMVETELDGLISQFLTQLTLVDV